MNQTLFVSKYTEVLTFIQNQFEHYDTSITNDQIQKQPNETDEEFIGKDNTLSNKIKK